MKFRKLKFQELWQLCKAKEVVWFQRSRSKWLKEEDVNSKFFHRSVKLGSTRNAIKALRLDDAWIQSPSDVRRVVVDYFRRQVLNTPWEHPKLDGVMLRTYLSRRIRV